jgi:hypothetical protein
MSVIRTDINNKHHCMKVLYMKDMLFPSAYIFCIRSEGLSFFMTKSYSITRKL